METSIFTADEKLVALEFEIFDSLRALIADNRERIHKSASLIAEIDVYRSFAEVFGLKKSNLTTCQALANNYPNTTLTPHSTYSIQQRDFNALLAGNTNLLTIHFKESEGEEQLFDNQGPLAEWYSSVGFECDFLNFASPAERIVRTIPATQSVMFVHNSYVTQSDIDKIMGHFTAPVYWVLCPRSNRYISGEITDAYKLLMANNLNILIGTDSLASNSSLSIIEELKMFRDIPLAELLQWATINGAKALGIDNHYGTIEVGKRSGIVNITGVDLENFTLTASAQAKRVL